MWQWTVFNSPSGYAAKCFLAGEMIAAINGEKIIMENKDFYGHANMLSNLCFAHVQVYHALKCIFQCNCKLENFHNEPQIGLMKNIFQLEPSTIIDNIGTYLTKKLLDDPIYEFFTKGTYTHAINPFTSGTLLLTDYNAPHTVDFIGLNYYSHKKLHYFKPTAFEQDIPTANENYTIYPEGIYYALEEIDKKLATPLSRKQKKNIPIYITECGIATHNDKDKDKDREIFYTKYLYALQEAIKDGIYVKGFITWSLMNNYEWGAVYYGVKSKPYGLFKVDYDKYDKNGNLIYKGSMKRTLKNDAGTKYFLDMVKNQKHLTTKEIDNNIKENTNIKLFEKTY